MLWCFGGHTLELVIVVPPSGSWGVHFGGLDDIQ